MLNESQKHRQECLQLVHELIKKLLDTIPLTKVTIIKALRSEFPYFRSPHGNILSHIENLLKIIEYSPCFTNEILNLILENILNIDVNVTKDQIDLAEEMVDDDELLLRMRLPLAETLDQVMEKMLDYFHSIFTEVKNSHLQGTITAALFEYFDEHIIKTSTKHMQFLLFFISSVNVSCAKM